MRQSFKWKPTTCAEPTNSATARNTSSNHLRLQKADAPIIQMEADHLRETHKLRNIKKDFKQSPEAAKG